MDLVLISHPLTQRIHDDKVYSFSDSISYYNILRRYVVGLEIVKLALNLE